MGFFVKSVVVFCLFVSVLFVCAYACVYVSVHLSVNYTVSITHRARPLVLRHMTRLKITISAVMSLHRLEFYSDIIIIIIIIMTKTPLSRPPIN